MTDKSEAGDFSAVRVWRAHGNGSRGGIIGHAIKTAAGWVFVPYLIGRPLGRIAESWEKCLPKWVCYPDGCESRRMEPVER